MKLFGSNLNWIECLLNKLITTITKHYYGKLSGRNVLTRNRSFNE